MKLFRRLRLFISLLSALLTLVAVVGWIRSYYYQSFLYVGDAQKHFYCALNLGRFVVGKRLYHEPVRAYRTWTDQRLTPNLIPYKPWSYRSRGEKRIGEPGAAVPYSYQWW